MDSYSYAAISSSSNSCSSSSSSIPYSKYPQEVKKNKPLPSYHSSLHGVRRLPSKPMTKQPIAPLPPTPPKIYKVEPVNFKEVVQMLTAAPEFQSNSSNSSSGSGSSSSSSSRRLQDVAPPPLDLSPVSLPRNNIAAEWREFLRPSYSSNNQVESISVACNDSTNEAQERSHVTPRNLSENLFGSCSPLANFPLSPASFAWCSSILLSPGTLPSPNAVL
ncbi:uncharacterized protein LOC107815780 [Nicotiana tabacum]|uniref:Serine/arginine repetitive matrix protein 2-like n=2 Tax=Nicotiana TaxID=4085 RepID=A0A1S4C723_TOBAC|nr:PREDICTED: serine/arginine repetitive matrix protein 2-like [Nicotiana sylvestris]XP_016496896.1 PREDICTED: serine/arginine repetitive matrix protein 2-like [Nicotiana tabacum]